MSSTKYFYGVIAALLAIIYYLNIKLKSSNNVKIYWFYKPNCKFCKKMEDEWKTVELKITDKYCAIKIDVSKPEYFKMRKNFDVKTVPQIVKVDNIGNRYMYDGKRDHKKILEWIYDGSL
jgi:glutaredoxin